MRILLSSLVILLASLPAYAHVGSADVYYEGDAGPYHLFVTVRLPQVIPGIAEIQVRSASPNVETIQVVPSRLTGPSANLLSVPDVAQRSKDDPQFFVSSLWLMEFGALQVHIQADGSKGKAELSVPVASFARQSAPLHWELRGLLIFFFMLLALTAVLILGATVRESTVAPGKAPQVTNRRLSRVVMATALMVAAMILYTGRAWWNVEAATYQRNVDLLRPPQAETTLLNGNRLVIRPARTLMVPNAGQWVNTEEVKMGELIPDHGHLMHLFLIAMPGMDKMWHLHPVRADDAFIQSLPAMPAGQYQLFADIVDRSGYPWTLVGNVQLPQINGQPLVGDDSDWEGARLKIPPAGVTVAQLPGGGRMVWERGNGSLRANMPATLKFLVEDKDGSPARDVEPYMGMVAHAEVVCSDLSVFAHIHPTGTVSMAALDLAQTGLMAQPMAGPSAMEMASSSSPMPPEFSFPYGFPHAGDYRIFVQIKRSGKLLGAAFDAHVQ
jgi:hypothetical protein